MKTSTSPVKTGLLQFITIRLTRISNGQQSITFLHWLKIRERIAYKIAFLIIRCKNNQAPAYLQELLPSKHHERPLRSSMTEYLNSDFCKNTHTLRSSFSAAGPRIWNSLPLDTKIENCTIIFRKELKSHLFKISYG